MLQVAEFIPERRGDKEIVKANVLYRWRGSDDKIVKHGESIRLFDELSLHTGFSRNEINEELQKKEKVIEWMIKFNVCNVIDVGRIIAKYYRDPEEVMAMVQKGIPFKKETPKAKKESGQ